MASNPGITNINAVQAGQVIYIPQKQSDGSTTYNFAGGAIVKQSAASGEYYMVVPNTSAQGGFTVYERKTDGDASYLVRQVTTNAAGSVTFESTGYQATLNADVRNISATAQNGTGATLTTTTAQFYGDNSRLETTTTPDGTVLQKSFDTGQQLTGTITDTPDGQGGTNRMVTTVVNGKQVQITQQVNAAALAIDNDGDFDTTDIDIDGQDALNSDLLQNALDNSYQSAQAIIRSVGTGQLGQLIAAGDRGDADGFTPASGCSDAPDQDKAWYETDDAKGLGGTLTQVQSLISALKRGSPLPIAVVVFNLAARLSSNPELGSIAGGLNVVAGLKGFTDALERGDEFGALASVAGFVNDEYKGKCKHYKNRSCLRTYLLGWRATRRLKKARNDNFGRVMT